MIYYANGCSYTWGGSLFELTHKDKWMPELTESDPVSQERLQSVYPHHLGKLIGAEKTINESLGGGSNFRIVRKTLEYFNNLILNDQPIKNHFVTIQWTEPSRCEFYYKDIDSWANLMAQVVVPEKRVKLPSYVTDSHKNHYGYNHSVLQDFHFFINHVYTLGNFFERYKIPYLFFKHSGWDSTFYKENIIQKESLDKLLSQFNWLHDDLNYDMQKSHIEKVTDSHPNRKGHIQWADVLFQEIQKKKLINLNLSI